MLFLFGWGKNAKPIAYLGVIKCGHCKNYSHFHLYETYNNIKLYFVPVAKFNKKYIMACDTCQAGLELNENQKLKLLQASMNILPQEEYVMVWNMLRKNIFPMLEEWIEKLNEKNLLLSIEELNERQKQEYFKIKDTYKKKINVVIDDIVSTTTYPKEAIGNIVGVLIESAFDTDIAK